MISDFVSQLIANSMALLHNSITAPELDVTTGVSCKKGISSQNGKIFLNKLIETYILSMNIKRNQRTEKWSETLITKIILWKKKLIFLKSNWKTRSILSTGGYTKIEDAESNRSFC